MEITKNQRQCDTNGEDKELNDVSENNRTHSTDCGIDDHDTTADKDAVELRDIQEDVKDITPVTILAKFP